MAIVRKRLVLAAAILLGFLSCAITYLGIRQFALSRHYDDVIGRSERLVFQFMGVKEYVTEAVLRGESFDLERVVAEFNDLNDQITGILEDILIPDEYKLAFISQVDLSGILLDLRKMQACEGNSCRELAHDLISRMREVSERLNRFGGVVSHHAHRQVVGFQLLVIGTLACLLSLVFITAVYIKKKFFAPLSELVRELEFEDAGGPREITIAEGSGEILAITRYCNGLLSSRNVASWHLSRHERIAAAIHEADGAVERSRDKKGLYQGVCRALLSNPDYCLVWIGVPDSSGEDLEPFIAEGCKSMKERECEECMAVLHASAEEKGIEFNPSRQAFLSRKSVVLRNILEDVPKGPLRRTPFARGTACCAAIPLQAGGMCHGVLSIYAVDETCFDDHEMRILELAARNMSLKASALERQGESRSIAIETFKLASVGGIAGQMAGEVSGLVNGIINYAQLILDQIRESAFEGQEQVFLEKIIEDGGRISGIVRKFLDLAEESGKAERSDTFSLEDVVSEAVSLVSRSWKLDSIAYSCKMPEKIKPVPGHRDQILLVLLRILNDARDALNARYPSGMEKEKQISIRIAEVIREGQPSIARFCVRVPIAEAFGTFLASSGLSICKDQEECRKARICQQIVDAHGGRLSVVPVSDSETELMVDLPTRE